MLHLAQAVDKVVVSVISFVLTYDNAILNILHNNSALEYIFFTAIVNVTPMILFTAIGVSSWTVHKYKRHWFMIDQASRNPYKLVYKVVKFAAEHKTPIRRSAFTYCEDELPSRMDLGKDKYGGPFTTEQVEDVKAFLGIITLLLIL